MVSYFQRPLFYTLYNLYQYDMMNQITIGLFGRVFKYDCYNHPTWKGDLNLIDHEKRCTVMPR